MAGTGKRWVITLLASLAGFGGCWVGLAAARVLDTGSQIGVASVPLVIGLAIGGAWAERQRDRDPDNRDENDAAENISPGHLVGQLTDGVSIGPGAVLHNPVFRLGRDNNGSELLRDVGARDNAVADRDEPHTAPETGQLAVGVTPGMPAHRAGGATAPGLKSLDFDVLFEQQGAECRARILASPVGNGPDVRFPDAFKDIKLEITKAQDGQPEQQGRNPEDYLEAIARQSGRRLFGAVFGGTAGLCFLRSLDHAGAENAALRIRLQFAECPELTNVPWELLCSTVDDSFFALSTKTPLIRYTQMPAQPWATAVQPPLRVLVVKSEPADYPPLDLAAEWAQVTGALGGVTGPGSLSLTELSTPSLRELRRILARDTFDVLHYIGYGQLDEQGVSTLIFADEVGRGKPTSGQALGVLLRDHESLRLAVLDARQVPDSVSSSVSELAAGLVRRGIPAVIGMQFGMPDAASVEFAAALYWALAGGRPVATAVAEARKAVFSLSPIAWAAPALYLGIDDARFFEVAKSAAPPASLAVTHAEQGDSLSRQRRFYDAEAAYRAAIELDPSLSRAYSGLGEVLDRQGRFLAAKGACLDAIRLDPVLASAYSNLGHVLSSMGQDDAALSACRKAVRLDPSDASAHNNLAFALFSIKNYGEAEAACRDAIQLNPDLAYAHNNLGSVLLDLQRYPEAETACREAIRLDPDLAYAHNNLASALRSLGRLGEARDACREAISIDPEYANAHNNLGIVMMELGMRGEAEASYIEAIRLDPSLDSARTNLQLLRYDTRSAGERNSEDLADGRGQYPEVAPLPNPASSTQTAGLPHAEERG